MDLSALDALDGVSPVSTDANANEEFASATSLPVVRVDTQEEEPKDEEKDPLPIDQEPDDEDREHAQKIFDGDESFLKKDLAAAWLGERVPRHARTRKAYMELFDWSGYNILLAFRDLCTRLVVKAESQQLDRVIDAFSQRWCACNLSHGFKSPDVVHTIAYSILMLNTDLHIADINERMTRSQFVKNTLPTIRRIADESAGDLQVEEVTTIRPTSTQIRFPLPWSQDSDTNKTSSSPTSPNFPATDAVDTIRGSLDAKRPAPLDTQNPGDACTVLVHTPYKGNMKGWEAQLEVVLREFYNSIRAQRLPLHGVTTANGHMLGEQQSNNSLAVMAGNVLRRTPSVLSKAPSDTVSYRGRADLRSMTGRWMPSKTRSRPRLTPGLTSSSTMGSSSRTSFDDGSVWSPATSHSTWSKYRHNSFMSVESLGSMSNAADYQRSIGFANALSQAIVREGSMNFGGSAVNLSEEMGNGGVALLEDESLELEGPPWAKEGILQHRHHLERVDRAGKDSKKDKGWAEAFAVIEKGVMRLFLFKHGAGKDSSSSSPAPFAPVGGGNWLDNAEPAGEFLLRQTIASALPPPGFSPSRSHVWALSLPTGAVHLFQAGTPEMVVEWVTTANYWSARLSKAPLGEAVSNVEYGWGDGLLNAAVGLPRPSFASHDTARTSFEASFSASNSAVRSGTRPGDRATVHEWQQPTASMMASNLSEAEQLATLTAYVTTVEQELVTHNELRAAMRHVFSARHANTVRAMNNWERKSSYLLREIVKWRTYVEGLKEAGERKRGVDEKREKARIEKGEAEKEEKGSVENEEVETEEKVDEIPS
ncbi:SEC7-like protein [Eremomyces bilateralis CBS 781.70]|uniref:SEC7-like protein n=1 Tax=Eremomyces bilateralis CBS 781.70 TaxID=1392243 RepID=A0A6G1FY11_9PEZI|nr:SEC7-like protein [Eremomyces bilateralis CBS 781.70]KAF1810664.1 SEC7-like protein [Eremomyces bilateralis CBS 781.70]